MGFVNCGELSTLVEAMRVSRTRDKDGNDITYLATMQLSSQDKATSVFKHLFSTEIALSCLKLMVLNGN